MYDVLAASYPSFLSMTFQELSLVVTNDGFTSKNTTLGKQVNATVGFITPDPYTSTGLMGATILNSIVNSFKKNIFILSILIL